MADFAPPTGNRFAVVTPNDNSAPVIIATFLSLIFTVLVLAVRIFLVKWQRWSLDDAIIVGSHLVAFGQWAAMFIALKHGLGKALEIVSASDQNVMAKATFAAGCLLMPALCLSKLSVLVVLRRLFQHESARKLLIIDVTMLWVAAWGFAATIALSVGCSPLYLTQNGQCPHLVGRMRGVMLTEIITEFWLFLLCPLCLYSFDIALKTKFFVMSAFFCRLGIMPLSIFYLINFTSTNDSSPNSAPHTMSSVPYLIFQEVLLAYDLMSATIPCLKAFVEGFTTGGVGYVIDPNAGRIITTTTIGSGKSGKSGESYELMARAAKNRLKEGVDGEDGTVLDGKPDGAKRISARLSRAWNGPGNGEREMFSEASEVTAVRRTRDMEDDAEGDLQLLGERR